MPGVKVGVRGGMTGARGTSFFIPTFPGAL